MTRSALFLSLALMLAPTAAMASEPVPAPGASTPVAPALEAIARRAEATHTDALLIWQDGRPVLTRHRRPEAEAYPLMLGSRSVAALAVGLMLQQGRITSVDLPMSTWYPAFRSGHKAKITLRDVLTATDGLDALPRLQGMGHGFDRLKEVLPLSVNPHAVGCFSPQSEAIVLLSGIVKQVVGLPLDLYLDRDLFKPLGIAGWKWPKDPAGTPNADEGIAMRAVDVARLGQLMLQQGQWQGRRLIPADFAVTATSAIAGDEAEPNHGYLWSTLVTVTQTPAGRARLAAKGLNWTDKLAPLDGRTLYATRRSHLDLQAYFEAARPLLTAPELEALQVAVNLDWIIPVTWQAHRDAGFFAWGELGQQLVVLPRANVVAVRLRRHPGYPYNSLLDEDTFEDFAWRLAALYNR